MWYPDQIPEFRRWKLAFVESIFLDISRLKIYYRRAELEDEGELYWVGYRTRYANPDNLNRGVALNLFGKGEVVKIWDGIELDNRAILTSNGWQRFDAEDYDFQIQAVLDSERRLSTAYIILRSKESWRGTVRFRVVKATG